MGIQKLKKRDDLAKLIQKWHKKSLVVGFTSGAFDILHAGHVEFLENAKKHCDILIVGLNSDSSVRRYKGEEKPIISEQQRAIIISALESVDYVFIFDERRNKKNIETLQPDLYIKAEDYSIDQLTSKDALDQYGGKALLIPVETQTSTSKIIEKVKLLSSSSNPIVEFEKSIYFPKTESKSRPAIFLDRDGTINFDYEYIHEEEKFQLLPNVLVGLKKMQDMDFRLIIVTNQAGIGLGYFTKEDFYRINRHMFRLFSEKEIKIDKIYFCPHNVTENCSCRKPKTGLIKQAQSDLNIDMKHSFFIGDKTSDIQTGVNAGLKTILVTSGKKENDKDYSVKPDYITKDLLEAANWILEQERK